MFTSLIFIILVQFIAISIKITTELFLLTPQAITCFDTFLIYEYGRKEIIVTDYIYNQTKLVYFIYMRLNQTMLVNIYINEICAKQKKVKRPHILNIITHVLSYIIKYMWNVDIFIISTKLLLYEGVRISKF